MRSELPKKSAVQTDEFLPVHDSMAPEEIRSDATTEFRDVIRQIAAIDDRAGESVDNYMAMLRVRRPSFSFHEDDSTAQEARYIVRAEIGRGSIGAVCQARDRYLNRDVAIKALRADLIQKKGRLARFLSEAQITSQLEHPAVVPVYEIGLMPDEAPFFAMKLIRGSTLGTHMATFRKQKRVTRQMLGQFRVRLLRIFSRICQGMAFAHAKHVIHRDLKPDNIMTGEFGQIHIMDWGLAKIVGRPALIDDVPELDAEPVQTIRSELEIQTMDGVVAGTPAYMSPEQARGESDFLDYRSDVFTLGLILIEMLTLQRAIPPGEPDVVIDRIKKTGPISPRVLRPDIDIPVELDSICLCATAPRPENRYPSAYELWQDMRAYFEKNDLLASMYIGRE